MEGDVLRTGSRRVATRTRPNEDVLLRPAELVACQSVRQRQSTCPLARNQNTPPARPARQPVTQQHVNIPLAGSLGRMLFDTSEISKGTRDRGGQHKLGQK